LTLSNLERRCKTGRRCRAVSVLEFVTLTVLIQISSNLYPTITQESLMKRKTTVVYDTPEKRKEKEKAEYTNPDQMEVKVNKRDPAIKKSLTAGTAGGTENHAKKSNAASHRAAAHRP
jgi:hypothetical protein